MVIAIGLLGFIDLGTFGDPYFSFQKQILFTIISTLSKNKQKSMWEVKKISRILSTGRGILPCELVL